MRRTASALLLVGILLLFVGCMRIKQSEEVLELEGQGIYTLSGGEAVDRWRGYLVVQGSEVHLPENEVRYCLSDGTQLLTEQDPAGPHLPEDLEEAAQAAIPAYYQQQGRLYDLQDLLEAANAEYQSAPEAFQPWYVSQDTTLTARSEKAVWCLTEVMLPLGGAEMTSLQAGAVFDSASGEKLELWSLFRVPEQQAREALLADVRQEDPLRAEMLEVMTPEMVTFYPDYAEVFFPLGSLAGEQTPVVVSVSMEELTAVLRSWAVPQAGESAA